jgi:hypothetical protein
MRESDDRFRGEKSSRISDWIHPKGVQFYAPLSSSADSATLLPSGASPAL